MEPWIQTIVTVVCSVIASSGFWAYIQKRSDKNDVKTAMLLGLAHDRIVYLGMEYIDRGYITQDEYENLVKYLYDPYKSLMDKDTTALDKIIQEVNRLPMHNYHIDKEKMNEIK